MYASVLGYLGGLDCTVQDRDDVMTKKERLYIVSIYHDVDRS